jgi:hypothetical protein
MSTTNLGRIAFLFRSLYNADTQYDKLDIVRSNGAGYIALQPSLGVIPGTDETKWAVAWQDGINGTNGKNGVDGQDGAPGADGAEIVSAAFVGNSIIFTLSDSRTVTIINGKTALTGATGADGVPGNDGQSAYAAAQAGGYTDTQARFYADLAAISGLAGELAVI